MIDAKSAAEIALFDALNGNIEGVTVYQDAPANVALPVTIIGDLTGRSAGAKGDPDMIVSASIVSEFAAEERAPLLVAQGRIKELLHEEGFEVEGWIVRPLWLNDNAQLGEDGETYIGASLFDVWVLRA